MRMLHAILAIAIPVIAMVLMPMLAPMMDVVIAAPIMFLVASAIVLFGFEAALLLAGQSTMTIRASSFLLTAAVAGTLFIASLFSSPLGVALAIALLIRAGYVEYKLTHNREGAGLSPHETSFAEACENRHLAGAC